MSFVSGGFICCLMDDTSDVAPIRQETSTPTTDVTQRWLNVETTSERHLCARRPE